MVHLAHFCSDVTDPGHERTSKFGAALLQIDVTRPLQPHAHTLQLVGSQAAENEIAWASVVEKGFEISAQREEVMPDEVLPKHVAAAVPSGPSKVFEQEGSLSQIAR